MQTEPTPQSIPPVAPLILDRLRELYPAAFGSVRPLKVGILEDLVREVADSGYPFSKKGLTKALKAYANTIEYQSALQSGAARVDLAGAEVGTVSPDGAELAARRILKIQGYNRYMAKMARLEQEATPEPKAKPAAPKKEGKPKPAPTPAPAPATASAPTSKTLTLKKRPAKP